MDKTSRHVRLMHYTTRDAILPLILELFPHPHAIPASVCISYLTRRGFQCSNFEDAERFNDALDEDPLLSYAYDAWAEHASNCLGYEPVMSAVASFVLGCTKFPLETPGGEIDFLGPLHVAAFYNFKQLVPLAARLQPVNARTPTSGQPPLNLACRRGNHFCVEGLLALPGIDVNLRDSADGWSALMEASSEGHMETMQILLKVPELDVNAATAGGWTALLLTSVGGRSERVKLLLGAPGININAANSEGFTALTEATIGGHRETVRAILEAPGVDVNASVPAKFVPSALIYASAMGYEEIVGMLIARPEVNVNARNARGLTSLGWASRRGHSAIVALLLGVSRLRVDIVDKDGYTALSYAVEEGHQEVVDLIVDLWIQRCTDVGGGS